ADRQVWLLLVSVGLYSVTLFASWQVFRQWRASLGMAVLGAALGINSFLASQRPTWALAFIGLGLVLLARGGARGLEARWRSRGTDYSEELLPYATFIGLGLAALAVVISPLVPALSSRATYEAFWRVFREPWSKVEDTTGRLFGGLDSPQRRNPLLPGSGGVVDPSGEHPVGAGAPRGTRPVMRVKTGDPAPEPWAGGVRELESQVLPQRHWRAVTYDTYTGSGWINRERYTTPVAAGENLPVDHPEARKEFVQRFRVLGPNSTIYAAGQPLRVDQRLEVTARTPDDPISFSGVGLEYEVVSLVPNVTVSQLEAAGQDYPEHIRERYLSLPDVPERLRRTTEEVVAEAETAYGKARAIEEYLRQFEYDLSVPAAPADRDVVDYLVFELQRGFCDHFSTAMAVMLRLAGVPARVAVGYARGNYDHADGVWVVTEADAHAWVEVYFPGYGWIEFEPTPSQEVYVYPLGESWDRGRPRPPEPPPVETGWRWPLSVGETRWILVGLALVAALGATARRYVAWSRSTPEDRIAAAYFHLTRTLSWVGVSPKATETVREYWQRLREALAGEAIFVSTPWGKEWVWQFDRVSVPLRYILTAYERAQFAPARLGPQVAQRARQEAGRLRREFALLWLARRMGE
ncbi:MAG: transglutaminase domain-containing protein, partial [Anaerolineae bacterium]|nr:transglutaminase domain-containing protein [Anaerolineae bacterium]